MIDIHSPEFREKLANAMALTATVEELKFVYVRFYCDYLEDYPDCELLELARKYQLED
ncbi:MAG: hypothetical protein GWN86_07075 [Desulfobacterales bacterium]|nr:hypothetical protein [Desulfobacterales bacterium]